MLLHLNVSELWCLTLSYGCFFQITLLSHIWLETIRPRCCYTEYEIAFATQSIILSLHAYCLELRKSFFKIQSPSVLDLLSITFCSCSFNSQANGTCFTLLFMAALFFLVLASAQRHPAISHLLHTVSPSEVNRGSWLIVDTQVLGLKRHPPSWKLLVSMPGKQEDTVRAPRGWRLNSLVSS